MFKYSFSENMCRLLKMSKVVKRKHLIMLACINGYSLALLTVIIII